MENASKALLIAGAILIVIILIGIGVAVINSTSNIQDQAGSSADSMAAQTFNAQFTAYEGTGKSASQVTSLKSAVSASNATNTGHQVTINSGTAFTIETGAKYKVELVYGADGKSAYVTNINITK